MKNGLRARLSRSFLTVVSIVLIICIALAEISMLMLRRISVSNLTTAGQKASQSSEELLIDQAKSSSLDFVEAKTANINAQLTEISKNVSVMADYITYMYDNIDTVAQVPLYMAGELVEQGNAEGDQLSWVPCVEDTTGMDEERGMFGALKPLFSSIKSQYTNITSIYIATEAGVNVGYDSFTANKAGIPFYETRESNWYTNAKNDDIVYISDTYSDSLGRGLTITMSAPFYKADSFMGVIGVDILIEKLNEEVVATTFGANGYAILVSASGTIISAPNLKEDNTEPSLFLGKNSGQIIRDMSERETGISQSMLGGEAVYIIYAPVVLTGWNLAVILPVSAIVAPAQESNEKIMTITDQTANYVDNWIFRITLISFVIFVLILILAVVITRRIANDITRPILRLNDDAKSIGEGNLQYISDIKTGDEIENLSLTFETMAHSIREYIANISSITKEKERIGAELSIATHIQASMLPCIFPAFPDRDEFDIYASMTPAKEVGGDFYDFFMIDGNRLGVVMADVSGKGVPAALFMVIAKTLIKNHAQTGAAPGDIFTLVNSQLCESNDAGMFVTSFMGIYEIDTGRFTYANAGHNFPLVYHSETGSFDWLKSRPGFVLAGMEDIVYRQFEMKLAKDDILLLYTDGVTEALNPEKDLYGDPRLINLVNNDCVKRMNMEELTNYVRDDISVFANGAEQADDITILALKISK